MNVIFQGIAIQYNRHAQTFFWIVLGLAGYILVLIAALLLTGHAMAAAIIAAAITVAAVYTWRKISMPDIVYSTVTPHKPAIAESPVAYWSTAALSVIAAWCFSATLVPLMRHLMSTDITTPGAPAPLLSSMTTVISLLLIAPVLEETLIRGYVYPLLRRHLAPLGAGIISAIIFGAFHGNVLQALAVLPLGITLAWVVETTQRLTDAMVMHALFNLAACTPPMQHLIPNITIVTTLCIIALIVWVITAKRLYPDVASVSELSRSVSRTGAGRSSSCDDTSSSTDTSANKS